jgi:iron complex transport system substrate-binding protein
MRLVPLLPPATEIVYALGLGDQLVGVTFECDEPPSARADKTVVAGGLDTRRMTPREIDQYVQAGSPPTATCTPCTSRRRPTYSPT